MDLALDLDGVQASFSGNIEMIRSTERLSQLGRSVPGKLDRLFIAQRQAQHRLPDLLGNHGYR